MAGLRGASRAGLLLCIGVLSVNFFSGVDAKCTTELFKNGTSRKSDGCPDTAHGMYFTRERALIQDLLPVMVNFTDIASYSNLTDKDIGTRDYLRKRLKPLITSFGGLRCRCDKSILQTLNGEALGLEELRDELIEPIAVNSSTTGFKTLTDFYDSPTSVNAMEDLADFLTPLLENLRALRCGPTYSEARRNATRLTPLATNKNCRLVYRAKGKKVSVSRVICPKGSCPNYDEDY